jgi:hypothetical protein
MGSNEGNEADTVRHGAVRGSYSCGCASLASWREAPVHLPKRPQRVLGIPTQHSSQE